MAKAFPERANSPIHSNPDLCLQAVVPERYLSGDVTYHLQPSGNFVLGGPQVGSCIC